MDKYCHLTVNLMMESNSVFCHNDVTNATMTSRSALLSRTTSASTAARGRSPASPAARASGRGSPTWSTGSILISGTLLIELQLQCPCGIVALWHCAAALRHCGTMALWHCSTVALIIAIHIEVFQRSRAVQIVGQVVG